MALAGRGAAGAGAGGADAARPATPHPMPAGGSELHSRELDFAPHPGTGSLDQGR